MKIPDHSHEYLIPIATKEEIREGTSQDSVVVPKILGTASLYSYEEFAPLEQVVNTRQESEKAMARANGAQQVAEESKRVSEQALSEVTKTVQTATTALTTSHEAKEEAKAATTTANLAKDTADTAKGLAEEAKNTSDAVKHMAEETKAAVDRASGEINSTKGSLETALQNFAEVKQSSENAVNLSTEAKRLADESKTIATRAEQTAREASQTATETTQVAATAVATCHEVKKVAEAAKKGGEEASKLASEAKGLAEEAKGVADSVTEKVEKALKEASDAKSQAEGLETIANEAKNVAEQAKGEVDTTKQGLGEVKSSLDTVTATSNSANTAASEAKALAEEAKNALTEVQETIQTHSESLSAIQGNVNSLFTYFLENVHFVQPHKILEADPQNRKGLVINNGAFFRFYHGGDHGGRYILNRVPGRGTMSFQETLEAGKDYYIYLILKDQEHDLSYEISLNPTAPEGYTEHNSEKIGGFHTLCTDVGTIEEHPLSGYQAGDILPMSVWCLNHRPWCSPEGMVYNPLSNIWVDIYLQSGTGKNTKSAYGAPITTNRRYYEHQGDLASVRKRLLTNDEFTVSMTGSNYGTSISGNQAPSPKTSGGHIDTASRRMISHIGCEDGCGYVWQFLSGCYPVTKWHTGEQGSSLRVDINVMLGGGDWADGSNNDYLVRNFAHSRYEEDEKIGARGCSEPFYLSY
ncbi:hypothetical protein [Bartonella sp. AU55XJBT]|uniref:phage major tropism determinant n=1 Tax=Bartonella sp. AU55XJBT TaxID=3019091 RepID=UPI0023611241|nr:hypothetical protein [Bartonella sp. AU55XJBT]